VRAAFSSTSLKLRNFELRSFDFFSLLGMSGTDLKVLSVSLSAENPSPLWMFLRPARSLSSKPEEPLWEDMFGILDDSVLELRFILKSRTEPWWKLSVSCVSFCCFSNTEQQSLQLELVLVPTSQCMHQNECSVNLVVHFCGPISSPCPSVWPEGPIGFIASDNPSDERDDVLLPNKAVRVNAGQSEHQGKTLNLQHEKSLLCSVTSVLDDVWDAGMQLLPGNDGIFEVASLVSGSPADREGIAKGDLVFEAASKELRGLQLNEVSAFITSQHVFQRYIFEN
jgi:hypothetical protein